MQKFECNTAISIFCSRCVKRVIAVSFLFGYYSQLSAQNKKAEPPVKKQVLATQTPDTAVFAPFDFSRDLQEQLPGLDSLVMIAHAHSPTVHKFESFSQAQKEKIALAKKSWSSNIQVFTNYSIGNQTLLLTGTASSDLNQISNGFRVGVNVGLPISELLTRGNRITLAKAEAQAAAEQVDEAALLLEKEVVLVYYQLLNAYRQWRTNQSLVEKSAISELLSERKLLANEISIADYTRIAEIKASADSRKFESEKLLFESYFTLQALLGVSLNSLKR
jgi:outer membrane protein TolC